MEKTTNGVLAEISLSLNSIHQHLKSLAPSNSKYTGIDAFKKVDYIFVNNKRVHTNTGRLKNSVMARDKTKGASLVHEVYVSGASVPYYAKAVLKPTITRARHYGRLEYGETRYTSDVRWKHSLVEEVDNRNYMYFQKGAAFMRTELMKYNNRKIYVSDDIGRWQNGL